MILCSKSVFAQDNESIKAEIEQHREAIRQLEQQLGSSQGSDYEGAGEGLPGNAGVDRPWEQAADTNNDGVVDKAEINQWDNRGGREDKAKVDRPWEGKADLNNDGTVDKTEKQQWNNRKANREGGNPPGPKGGPGTDIGNPPGPKGGPGFGKGNPPGPKGGPGKGPGFQGNPPGPKGGPGAGKGNPPGPKGGPGKGPKNQKGKR